MYKAKIKVVLIACVALILATMFGLVGYYSNWFNNVDKITPSNSSEIIADVEMENTPNYPEVITDELLKYCDFEVASQTDINNIKKILTISNNIDGTPADFSHFRITQPNMNPIRFHGIVVPYSNIFPHLQSAYEFESITVKIDDKEMLPSEAYAKFNLPIYFFPWVGTKSIEVTYNLRQVAESELPETPEKEGHTFVGWFNGSTCLEDGTCTQLTSDEIMSNIDMHPHFEKIFFIVSYIVNNGIYKKEKIEWNTPAPNEEHYQRYYRFLGWFDEEGNKYMGEPITRQMTLTARYERSQFVVVFKDRESDREYERKTINSNEPITDLPTMTSNDYYFVGWIYEDGTRYTNQPITSDITLYAEWSIYKNYSITFDTAGGKPILATEISKKNYPSNLPIPTKTGYDFLGWIYEDGTSVENEPTADNFTLTATWKIKTFTITFYIDNIVYDTEIVNYGTSMAEVLDLTKSKGLSIKSVYMSGEIDLSQTGNVVITNNVDILSKPINDEFEKFFNNWKMILGLSCVAVFVAFIVVMVVKITKKHSKKLE